MPNSTYFVQECPTCGRCLHIRVEYLGKRVVCQHCRGVLIASDGSSRRMTGCQPTEDLLRRADELLERVVERPVWSHDPY